ncbi:hypothetical protein JMJ77_0009787, partial [Colletotrichum scovillei]
MSFSLTSIDSSMCMRMDARQEAIQAILQVEQTFR